MAPVRGPTISRAFAATFLAGVHANDCANTSRPVFTNWERSKAKSDWSASTARLNRESFLSFASCSLCLEPARDPVSCPQGDIFCRECALSNILSQKKEIKRLERLTEQEAKDRAEEQDRKDAEARERAILEFERTQQGLDVKASLRAAAATSSSEKDGNKATEERAEKGEKRKFELDDEELLRIALEDRTKARKTLDDEEASKPSLPSFWVPTITPTSNTKDTLYDVKKKTKSHPICPASQENEPHRYSLHTLVDVKFAEETDSATKQKQRICPACRKLLSNSSKAVMAKPCGHVVCKSCVDKFIRPSGKVDVHDPDHDPNAVRCYVCDEDITERNAKEGRSKNRDKIRPGLVDLRSEGTGYSASGSNKVQKSGVGFQC
ncbi:uncharacterized protein MKZ38_004252 [Zalerion maritima]|uniref:RING-type domain-containing protein n=1 Tax=Zalerion maritima TaxID=339359 RepID=A0AAD5RMV7_9PEZI|nr:uncharacterized protein MKZ38_004252 [Zalerion maritima]